MNKSISGIAFCLAMACISLGAYATPINLALSGTASQSSTYHDPGLIEVASAAIDGVTDGNLLNNPVTHTNAEYRAWWQVDLGGTYAIENIVLWNRTDCCSERLSNFHVSILDSLGNELTGQDFANFGSNPSLSIVFQNAQVGKIVKVQLFGTDFLSLAEVQVFGDATPIPVPPTILLIGLGFLCLMKFVRHG